MLAINSWPEPDRCKLRSQRMLELAKKKLLLKEEQKLTELVTLDSSFSKSVLLLFWDFIFKY